MIGRRDQELDGVNYAVGRKFRVVKEGARLTGLKPEQPSVWQGWGQALHVGDVIECTGYGPGWGSDPGYGVEFTSEKAREENATSVDFDPAVGGMWSYHPAPGYLEPINEQETKEEEQ